MKKEPQLINFMQKISNSCISLLDILSKPKMKIALISYYYNKPTTSGVGIHVQNLAKALFKHNCKVHVFCSGYEDAVYKEEGITVHAIGEIVMPVGDKFCKKRLDYDIFESEVVKEIIRENEKQKFDIIHTHGALTKAAFIIKKVYGTKWIHTFHAIEKLRTEELSKEEKQFADLISWIESTVNYCDGTIFVSNELLKEGIKHYKIKYKKVIPNGVDLELFSYAPIKKKNVLFVGRFSKEKGIDLFPKIIPEIMSVNNTTLTIVCPHKGLGGELKEIRESLQKQQDTYKERLIIIEKPQVQEVIRKLYKNCQVYIQPSKYESFGLCILEAMATGRPVIAFNVGGIPEVIGNEGFIVKNTKELIYKIKELLNNKEQCIIIGKRAAQRAKKFDWNIIAKKTIEFYNEVKK